MARTIVSTPPGMWRLPSLLTLPPSLLCVLIHRQSRASLFTATLRSAVNKDRFGLRVERLRPASSLRDARHPPSSGSAASLRLRSQTLFDGYTLAITDTSGCAYGVGPLPLRCQPETYACFSGSSMSGRCSPSYGRSEPSVSTFLPPIEEVALAIQPPAVFYYSSATHSPTPPASAPQAPMCGAPMS